jgi:chaperone required for assembly of F1-ATPase
MPAKRFFAVASTEATADGRWRLTLDGRPARTPAKHEVAVPSEPLAMIVAAEWQAQPARLDPASMPMTRLLNSAIDGVAGREAEVAADIIKYAMSDLVCYRAERPEGLVERQSALWDPVLTWAEGRYAIRLARQSGVIPVSQSPGVSQRLGGALAGLGHFRLAALHVMTTLMGSALLALAVAERHLGAEEAWTAAHVDEDWQIAKWGSDAEATARRAGRHQDMLAAARLISLLGPEPDRRGPRK